jgi:hypothetical protein
MIERARAETKGRHLIVYNLRVLLSNYCIF